MSSRPAVPCGDAPRNCIRESGLSRMAEGSKASAATPPRASVSNNDGVGRKVSGATPRLSSGSPARPAMGTLRQYSMSATRSISRRRWL